MMAEGLRDGNKRTTEANSKEKVKKSEQQEFITSKELRKVCDFKCSIEKQTRGTLHLHVILSTDQYPELQ